MYTVGYCEDLTVRINIKSPYQIRPINIINMYVWLMGSIGKLLLLDEIGMGMSLAIYFCSPTRPTSASSPSPSFLNTAWHGMHNLEASRALPSLRY
jgi:hypothetical protein